MFVCLSVFSLLIVPRYYMWPEEEVCVCVRVIVDIYPAACYQNASWQLRVFFTARYIQVPIPIRQYSAKRMRCHAIRVGPSFRRGRGCWPWVVGGSSSRIDCGAVAASDSFMYP